MPRQSLSQPVREPLAHARLVHAFETALTQLCANFGVVLVHEDGHGFAHLIKVREGETAGCRIEIADYALDETSRGHFL